MSVSQSSTMNTAQPSICLGADLTQVTSTDCQLKGQTRDLPYRATVPPPNHDVASCMLSPMDWPNFFRKHSAHAYGILFIIKENESVHRW